MKYEEALKIISNYNNPGYIINFEARHGIGYLSDFFPNKEEEKIKDIDKAYELAREFAIATKGKCFNIRVCDSETYKSVNKDFILNPLSDLLNKEIKIDSEITDSRLRPSYTEATYTDANGNPYYKP